MSREGVGGKPQKKPQASDGRGSGTHKRATAHLKKYYFSKTNQPTRKQKKEGRNRKKEAQKMMDFLREVQYMSQKQIKEYIEVHGEDIPVGQLIILKYLSDVLVLPQARIDYLNRHMSHANHIREDNDIQEEEKLFTQIEVIIDEPKSIEAKTDD